ncbi:phage tail spike protein [Streptococcus oralis]|uniref:phage tail spike protein n=1 Tax=Streptococcus oralis TaxID=1303 RepID=UPI001E610C80|nr:phage tail spike protein [Streptococcus oralis]
MLYLLNKDVRTVRWNGEPLHEATSAIVKETMNGDFTLTVKYPISDSGIYQLIQEDMLIKAPTPVLGAQLFRIKKPVEHNDHLEITAYHISDDVMQRSITPVSVTSQSCGMALSRMVQNTKTALGDFSFNSDIQDRRTFNTTETETLYSVLLDGKHSIVGTWEGELVRDNFAMTIKKSRGENRGVVITTHKNLKDYQRTKNSQNVVTRIHAKSTFKPEGAEKETTIRVTVDSPLINSYPYINEKEYENNNAKSVEELQKWAQAKFTNQGIDKVSDAIKIEAFELDGQVVHMGDTVNLKSWKHNVDAFKKAIAYEFDALKEEYISLTFDDKAGIGGSRASGGLSSAADAILGVAESAQEIALEKALQNADLDFDHQAGLLRQEISDGIELAKAKAEEVKRELSDIIDQRFSSFDNASIQEAKRRAEEALRNAGASSLLAQEAKRIGLDSIARLEEFKRQTTSAQTALSGDLDALKRTIVNDIRPKQEQVTAEIAKQVEALTQTKKELAGVKTAQATYEETTTRRLAELANVADGKASKSELTQTAEELASKIASVRVGGVNLFKGSKDFSGSWVNLGNWTRESEKYQGMTVMSRVGTWFGISQAFETKKGEVYTLSFYIKSSIDRDRVNVYFTHASTNQLARTSPYMSSVNISNEWQRTSVTFEITESGFILPRIERFNTEAPVYVAGLKLERGNISTDYSEAPEDIEGQISIVESSFRQRADALDAGVSRLTEGLRTKVDISSLNVTAENIRQSVKSLETDTQNKLNQKLSTAEFDVRASGIRQEIVNATKDKADRALVTAEAGKLRTELSTVQAYIEKDSQRQDALQRYAREESARQVNAVREQISRDYVGKATHQEDVRGLERRFESITNPQNGTIATQIANYNQSVDGRFAGIISQIATKANQTDFQRVQETSKLYERIIGRSESDIADKVARMALTNQLFQIEVAKNASNGQNLLKGTKDFSGDWKNKSANWKKHAEKYKGVDVLFKNNSWNGIGQEIDVKIGEIYTFSLWMKSDWKNDTVNFYVNRNGSVEKGWGIPASTSVAITNEWKRYSFTFNITANGFIFPRVERLNQDTNLYVAGLKLEKGSYATPYTEAPEDTNEAIRSVQTQLAGSWAVQNLTSAGDLISGINLGANGHNRITGKLTHITGETLIDKAVIKSAMVDKLKTANFEAGSVTTVILDAEAVTAEKLKVDQAFFNKLVANEAYLSQLFAKQAFINRVQSVAIDASQVRSGILSGDRIYGGTIRGASIYGGTLTGHTQIQLGSYGSFDTVNGGLQINVPRTVNAKDGLGVQFIGSYGRGENVPYGLFIYKDSDFTVGGTAETSDDFLLTVEGYINAKGIGWLKTGKGSVNGKTTGTIGLWNSDNVSLSFGGSGNDIYYSYNGTAYSLWSVVNQHFSDRRLKDNIVACEHKALDYIHQFQFKEYDWKKQEDRPQQAHTKIGLIAQEVQAVDSTLVYENGDTLNLDNLRLTNIALKAIQELALEYRKLTQRLEKLENERRTA